MPNYLDDFAFCLCLCYNPCACYHRYDMRIFISSMKCCNLPMSLSPCQPARLPAYCLVAFQTTSLPASQPAFRIVCLSSCLPSSLSAYQSASLKAGLLVCLPASLPSSLSTFQLVCLPACPPSSLSAFQLVCLPACLPSSLSAFQPVRRPACLAASQKKKFQIQSKVINKIRLNHFLLSLKQ
jgi:hypothetical protein